MSGIYIDQDPGIKGGGFDCDCACSNNLQAVVLPLGEGLLGVANQLTCEDCADAAGGGVVSTPVVTRSDAGLDQPVLHVEIGLPE